MNPSKERVRLIDDILELFEKSPALFAIGEVWSGSTSRGQKITMTFDIVKNQESEVVECATGVGKLTESDIADWFSNPVLPSFFEHVAKVWSRIEADREAIREEVMEGCFRMGEEVEWETTPGKWEKARIGAIILPITEGHSAIFNIQRVRRPPKTRPMTREEMEKKLWMTRQTDDQLRAMLAAIGESAEVEG